MILESGSGARNFPATVRLLLSNSRFLPVFLHRHLLILFLFLVFFLFLLMRGSYKVLRIFKKTSKMVRMKEFFFFLIFTTFLSAKFSSVFFLCFFFSFSLASFLSSWNLNFSSPPERNFLRLFHFSSSFAFSLQVPVRLK